jgi:plasmid replication initiation protein
MATSSSLSKATQLTFSVLDSPLRGDVQGDRNMAAFPFFALSKNPEYTPIVREFDNGAVKITVLPGPTGIATIYDKEVLIYLTSLIEESLSHNGRADRSFTFTAHDFFRVVGGNRSAHSYKRLRESIQRLQGTQISTTIKAAGKKNEAFFSWITEVHLETDGPDTKERLKSIRLTVCDWLYQAITKDKNSLTYHQKYFDLSAIERRIYEVAHSAPYENGCYSLTVEELFKRLGSSDTDIAKFRFRLRDIEKRQPLPEYHIALESGSDKPRQLRVIFKPAPKRLTDVAYILA